MKSLTDHTIAVGDRVEIFASGKFGKIVEIFPDRIRPRYLVRLPNGDHRELAAAQAAYAPDKRELVKRCEAIRQSWSTADWRSRAGLTAERDAESRYTIPIIHDEGGLLSEFYASEVG